MASNHHEKINIETVSNNNSTISSNIEILACSSAAASSSSSSSRYENQKRRDWNTFGQYLKNHRPPLALSRCSGAHVLEFLRYLDQFGKTKVHTPVGLYSLENSVTSVISLTMSSIITV